VGHDLNSCWEAKLCQNQVIHRLQAVLHNIRDRDLPCAAAAYQLVVPLAIDDSIRS